MNKTKTKTKIATSKIDGEIDSGDLDSSRVSMRPLAP